VPWDTAPQPHRIELRLPPAKAGPEAEPDNTDSSRKSIGKHPETPDGY